MAAGAAKAAVLVAERAEMATAGWDWEVEDKAVKVAAAVGWVWAEEETVGAEAAEEAAVALAAGMGRGV